MTRLLRWGVRLLVGLVVLSIVTAVGAVWLVRRPFPDVAGELQLDALDAGVDVYRDANGVPHIYASTPKDLFRAQGYVHAQDRFWQMDFYRHVGSGTTAELFGSSQVDTDRFVRTLGWRRAAEADWRALSDETRSYLRAYAQGVNAYLERRSGTAAGLEYAILALRNRGYQPEAWTPVDSLVWGKILAWDLRSNIEDEVSRALISTRVDRDRVEQLWPEYPARHPTVITRDAAPGTPARGDTAARTGAASNQRMATGHGDASTGERTSGALPVAAHDELRDVTGNLRALDRLLGPAGAGIGSNSWVVGGRHTASGAPLLANDPHLGPQLPSIWYEVGLHCRTQGRACPFDVAGFSIPGTAGVLIGHNDHVAWGFTNSGADVTDLYIEKTAPDNPDRYQLNGEWTRMNVDQQVIEVAGGDPVTHEVRTTAHGPVISDVSEEIADLGDDTATAAPDEYAVSLGWTAIAEPSRIAGAVLDLNRARNWEQFRAALRKFDAPSQNVVYADVEGNIGYQLPGRIPVRSQADGRWPVPGWTGEHAWEGYVDYDQLPRVLNPPQDYVVTANNPITPTESPSPFITADWAHGYRAQRIVDMIETGGPGAVGDRGANPDRDGDPGTGTGQGEVGGLTVENMTAMQADSFNPNARRMVDTLDDLDLSDDRELAAARDVLGAWDFRQPADSRAAALFNAFWRALLARTFHDELPESQLPGGGSRWFEVVRRLLDAPPSVWWDDMTTVDTVETPDDILQIALRDAVDEIERRFGGGPGSGRWGPMHTLTLENQSFGQSGIGAIEWLFNRGPYHLAGGEGLVNANGFHAPTGYEVDKIPSLRMVVELADLDATRAIYAGGQSGHAFHPRYSDLADRWVDHQTAGLPFTRGAVEDAAAHHLRLTTTTDESSGS